MIFLVLEGLKGVFGGLKFKQKFSYRFEGNTIDEDNINKKFFISFLQQKLKEVPKTDQNKFKSSKFLQNCC